MAIVEEDTPGRLPDVAGSGGSGGLLSWVQSRAGPNGWWANKRDTEYQDRWESYYRLWRGIWSSRDKNRKSERSRLIAPALSQAIEAITAEIESAMLDKAAFFDIEDDPQDRGEVISATQLARQEELNQAQQDMVNLRKRLHYDMLQADYDLSMAEIFLNGALFGTGIGKIDFKDIEYIEVERGPDGELVKQMRTKPQATLVPIIPQQFNIDTAAKKLKDALGYAHTYSSPRHEILALQKQGVFFDAPVMHQTPKDPILSDENTDANSDSVNIIDYRGKVPRKLLEEFLMERELELTVGDAPEDVEIGEGEVFVDLETGPAGNEDALLETRETHHEVEDDLVEAFVVIMNEQYILKAEENSTLYEDRLVVAYRHEIVPDQFWGRGAAEKGYNSQKQLDASMRARIDGLALTVHPMMAVDSARMPKGFKLQVSPGRNIFTNGDPKEILNPLRFGDIDPNIFTDNAELERMVSLATGGPDTAAPVTVNGRNETAAGQSMQLGNFVKRSKRTIRNIEKEFVVPLVQQTARLYMQFDPERYPFSDYTFRAVSVLGTMARELEQMQYATMLNTVPENSPAFWMLMKSFYQSSSLSTREDFIPMIDDQLKQSLNPEPPKPTLIDKLNMLQITEGIKAERSRQFTNLIRARAEVARVANDARMAPSEEAENESSAILNLAKAEAEEQGTQMEKYKAQLDVLERDAAASQEILNSVIKSAELGEVSAGVRNDLNAGLEGLLR